VISGFRREVAENSVLLGYYTASSGNFLPTFRDNLSVSYWGPDSLTRSMGPMACPETSVRNYRYSLRNNLEERISCNNILIVTLGLLSLLLPSVIILCLITHAVARWRRPFSLTYRPVQMSFGCVGMHLRIYTHRLRVVFLAWMSHSFVVTDII